MTDSGSAETARSDTAVVFISYASQDAAIADALVAALEAYGLGCWIAPRDVIPGSLYADGIVRAISGTRVFVLVLSDHAVASPHVGKEIERASSKRRPIIAIHTDTARLTPAFEYFLSESQWIDLKPGGTDVAAAKLAEAVRRHLGSNLMADPNAHSDPPAVRFRESVPRAKLIVAFGVAVLALAFAVLGAHKYWLSKHAEVDLPPTTALPAVGDKSIAVLPFADMSANRDQEYFADGLSEELIDMLTKVPDLRVPARTSAFYFKGKQATITEIAKALGVSHVLEGSVRKSGNKLRVTAQLIRVDNGYHVWSETYDRKLDDIFAVQDDIAGAVVKALKVRLLQPGSSRTALTGNAEAYALYLQGRSIHRRGATRADFLKSDEYLQEAVRSDPVFAAAWTELGRLRLTQYFFRYLPVERASQEARSAVERALALDPTFSEAHSAAGAIRRELDWDWTGANAEFGKALTLDPTNPTVLRDAASMASVFGRFDEALRLLQQARAQDPLDEDTYERIARVLSNMGRYSEAEASYRKALDLNPAHFALHINIALTVLLRGDAVAALAEMQKEQPLIRPLGLAIVYYALGRTADSDAAMAEADKLNSNAAFWLAGAHAYRGELDQAFMWLDRAYARHENALIGIKSLPMLRNLHGDPRYTAMLRKMKLPE